jgi:hypothetical protein
MTGLDTLGTEQNFEAKEVLGLVLRSHNLSEDFGTNNTGWLSNK